MRHHDMWKAIAIRGYRALIRICPPFLARDADEMVSIFRSALTKEIDERGFRGYLNFCMGALADTLHFAGAEWLAAGRERIACLRQPAESLGESRRPTSWRISLALLAGQTRFEMRSLCKTPLVTATALLTVALAVGLSAMTFSALYGTLLRPLPFVAGERLMSVELASESGRRIELEALDLLDFRERQTAFEGLEGYFQRRVTLQSNAGPARALRAGIVTAGALQHLGARPFLGRVFRQGEDFTDAIGHVVLGYDLWRDRFGGQRDVLGAKVRIGGRMLEVIGVMPDGFRFPEREQLWLPMDFDLPREDRGSGRSFSVFGRLREGVDRAEAEAEARVVAAGIGRTNPDVHPPTLSARVTPFAEDHLPAGLASAARILVVAVAGVLLIACANVVNLLLARSVLRSRETTVRRALGAGRPAIVSQFLVEALLLSGFGTLLGLALAAAGMGWLERAMSRFLLPYWVEVRLDEPVIAACAVVAVLFALAAGLFAAWQSGAIRAGALVIASRSGDLPRLGRVSRKLVTAQIAVSCALLIAAGLLVKSLVHARTLDRGYDADRVMTAALRLPAMDYPSPESRGELFSTFLERTVELPGVTGAALVRSPPGTGPTFGWEFQVEGSASRPSAVLPMADGVPISHGYFDVMGIELRRGRDFTPEESRHGSQPAVIVNETLAGRHLEPDPIGRRLRLGGDASEPWLTVVGVVADAYIGSSSGGIGLTREKREQIYISWGVAPYSAATVLTRSESGDPLALAPHARELLADIAPALALDRIAHLGRTIDASTWAISLFGSLFGLFGAVAFALSILGLYGVTVFAVNRRRQEMGLRMALGAAPRSILRLVLGSTTWQLVAGTAIGSLFGYGLARTIESTLFGVGAADASVYGAVALVLNVTGVWAALLSARDAVRVDPAEVLDG